MACFGYAVYSDEGSLKPLALQAASALRAVVFERTQPARAYTIPTRPGRFGRGVGIPPSS